MIKMDAYVLQTTQFHHLSDLDLYLSRLYQTTVMVQTQMCEINRRECCSTAGRSMQSALITTCIFGLFPVLQRCAMFCIFNKQCSLKTICTASKLCLHVSVYNAALLDLCCMFRPALVVIIWHVTGDVDEREP
jgi:hypothetical protein